MKKPMDPLAIMNTMGAAAHQKAQAPMPDDEEDQAVPSAPKMGASNKGKQMAAMKAKGTGKMVPNKSGQ